MVRIADEMIQALPTKFLLLEKVAIHVDIGATAAMAAPAGAEVADEYVAIAAVEAAKDMLCNEVVVGLLVAMMGRIIDVEEGSVIMYLSVIIKCCITVLVLIRMRMRFREIVLISSFDIILLWVLSENYNS